MRLTAKLFPILVVNVIFLSSCRSGSSSTISASSKNSSAPARSPSDAGGPALPRFPAKSEILLDHLYFKVSYNEEHRLPNWVSYPLSGKNLRLSKPKNKVPYFSDMALIKMHTPYAKPQDFDAAVYAWGALAPSEDFLWSQQAHDASFVMSNITPQKKKLYGGAWKPLENKVRKWACTEGSLKIISGPILDKSLKKFMSKVSIPKNFFKIVIDETPPRKAIAFILSQEDSQFVPEQKAVALAEAERQAGFLFLTETGFTKQEYAKIRSSFKLTDWTETDCALKTGAH